MHCIYKIYLLYFTCRDNLISLPQLTVHCTRIYFTAKCRCIYRIYLLYFTWDNLISLPQLTAHCTRIYTLYFTLLQSVGTSYRIYLLYFTCRDRYIRIPQRLKLYKNLQTLLFSIYFTAKCRCIYRFYLLYFTRRDNFIVIPQLTENCTRIFKLCTGFTFNILPV